MIYVAGPYTAETEAGVERNCHAAIAAGVAIQRLGHTAVIPHLTRLVDLWFDATGQERPGWQFYIDWDDALLVRCDALLYLGPSKGADIELDRAKLLGLSVFYALDEIPRWTVS